MFIYFFVFIISLWLFYLSCTSRGKILKVFCVILSALPPILLAGLRDEDVGADMQGYGSSLFYYSSTFSSFEDFLSYNIDEVGYAFLNYFCSHVSKSINFFLTVHQTIVLSFVIFTALRQKDKLTSVFILGFYYLFLYNTSLSMMRQIISVACILYGTSFLLDGKKYYFLICVIIAQLFHNSSFIALGIPFLLFMVQKMGNKQYIVYLCIIVFVFLVFAFFKTSLGSIILSISEKYESYLAQTGFKTHKIDILIFSMMLLLTFFTNRKIIIVCHQIRAFIILSIGILLLGSLFETANRLVYNIITPVWILMPALFVNRNANVRNAFLTAILLLTMYIYKANDSYTMTIPYKSTILGIN